MPRKKSQKNRDEESVKKGKKGGKSSHDQKKQTNDDTLDYIEIDEFTLDDVPGSDKS